MELLLVCPVAPLFMAPLLHPGLFHLSLAQAARALLISSLPFLGIPVVVCSVYHFLMPGWLRRVRNRLGRTALHAAAIIGSTLVVSTAIWLSGLWVYGPMRYELHVDETLDKALVPPLLLQPLLENALLHGLAQRREGGRVQLRVERQAGSLQVQVLDDGPGPGASPHHGSGTSLAELTQRICLLYGDAGSLRTGAGQGGGFLVQVTLPLEVS